MSSEEPRDFPTDEGGGTVRDDDAAVAAEVAAELCEAAGHPADVRVVSAQLPWVNIELSGGDSAEVWGRSGHVLDSLQLLVNLIAARRIGGDLRVSLDAGGYRERRAEALRAKAMEYASLVRESGEEAEFEPMPPNERRIIHTALVDDPDVTTYSEGNEPQRHIVITPRT
ncbi:MAG: KH domain-containing protein [Armatimonadetes bacterium]|nr:KH domain-containing protein [Armatimonadota bacterium]MDE2206125.1 KH domain-containing protein [Armatimonadota bacterium]